MSKSKIFIWISVAFAGGILLGSKFNIERSWLFMVMAFFIGGFALVSIYFAQSVLRWAFFFLFFACLGILRIQASVVPNEFNSSLGQKLSIEGIIVADVDVRTDKQLLTVKPEGYKQNILITTTKTGNFFYGDKVWLTGKLAEAKAFDDFDYKGYLERQNIYALMSYPKTVVLKSRQGNWFTGRLLLLKHLFIGRLNQILPEPYSSLLLGILIGARKSLPQDIIDNFTATGTSHIIAISGYNISIIISSLGFLAYYFGRKASFVLTLIIIFAFVIISGASASVIRASLMGGLLLTSFNIGRLYSITPGLCFAAFLMLIINPKILYWDAGFQLSFLATIGIVYGSPLFENLTVNWPNPLQIKSMLFTTLSAILATLPLISFEFGNISLVALPVNLLVLPAVPYAMFFGFFCALPVLGAGLGLITQGLLWYILEIISRFAKLPFASVPLQFKAWQVGLAYVLILVSFFGLKRISKTMPPDLK